MTNQYESYTRLASDLKVIATWLSRHTGLRFGFCPTRNSSLRYGVYGSDEGRAAKLIPDEIIADVLAIRHRTGLDDRDRIFLNLFAVAVATGFRIGELMTLPADCLIRDECALKIRNFTTKGGRIAPRPVAPEFVEMVTECVTDIRVMTDAPRTVAAQLDNERVLDWNRLVECGNKNEIATALRTWAVAWISDHERRMKDSRMAYSRQLGRWIEIEDAIGKFGSKLQVAKALGISRHLVYELLEQTAASREGRIYVRKEKEITAQAFETDKRVCSIAALVHDTGLSYTKIARVSSIARQIVSEAIEAQIYGRPMAVPSDSESVLDKFRRRPMVVLRCHRSGQVLLYARDALCTVFRDQLTAYDTQQGRVQVASPTMLSHWLGGQWRSKGNKTREDALFSRFGVIDPRTGDVANVTVHDLRHWLTTAYANGGLSKDQMTIVFNRKNADSHSSYLQTSSEERTARLREATTEGRVLGHHANTYARLAEESPEEASLYIEGALKFYNPMPHGICTLNMALEACPHSLRCFSCNNDGVGSGKACEHLIVDPANESQRVEITRINANAASMIALLKKMG